MLTKFVKYLEYLDEIGWTAPPNGTQSWKMSSPYISILSKSNATWYSFMDANKYKGMAKHILATRGNKT
jgi:hypothetical protein